MEAASSTTFQWFIWFGYMSFVAGGSSIILNCDTLDIRHLLLSFYNESMLVDKKGCLLGEAFIVFPYPCKLSSLSRGTERTWAVGMLRWKSCPDVVSWLCWDQVPVWHRIPPYFNSTHPHLDVNLSPKLLWWITLLALQVLFKHIDLVSLTITMVHDAPNFISL